MSAPNPNVLVVPALPALDSGEGVAQVHAALNHAGIEPLEAPGLPTDTEYRLALSPGGQLAADAFVESQRGLLGSSSGLIVVNSLTEMVPSQEEPICAVPNSVGYVASGFLRLANQIHGRNSGRVFLSHDHPNLAYLASTDSFRRTVLIARTRLLALTSISLVALRGDMGLAIKTLKGDPH